MTSIGRIAATVVGDWETLHRNDAYFSGKRHHAALDFVARITAKMLKDVRLQADDRVVEIGCGLGVMAAIVAPRVSSLVAVDVHPGPLRVASDLLDGQGCAVVGDGCSVPVASKSISFVYSISCFQHLPRVVVQSYVNEIRRIASPGCRVFIQVSAAPGGDHDARPGRRREESVRWSDSELSSLFPECDVDRWGQCWIVQGSMV